MRYGCTRVIIYGLHYFLKTWALSHRPSPIINSTLDRNIVTLHSRVTDVPHEAHYQQGDWINCFDHLIMRREGRKSCFLCKWVQTYYYTWHVLFCFFFFANYSDCYGWIEEPCTALWFSGLWSVYLLLLSQSSTRAGGGGTVGSYSKR